LTTVTTLSSPGSELVEQATSMTHEHLLAVVATETRRLGFPAVKLLDAGCGNGLLMRYLQANLPAVSGRIQIEVWGFDVHDEEIQPPGFLDEARGRLSARFPEENWENRLRVAAKDEPWPFGDESFDIVVSNQVGEHIPSLKTFFRENARVLRSGGVAAHLFPLRDYVLEGHLHLPLVHRILSHDLRRDVIAAMSRVGLGKFRTQGDDLDVWVERHSDYIHHLTHYRSWPQVAEAAKQAGLRVSYRYTPEFYLRRLARMAGRPYPYLLSSTNRSVRDAVLFRLVKRVSSVTIMLEKRQAFVKRGAVH
jgi:SAM-dependent methyltransferase